MAFTTTDGHTSGASAMRVEQGRMLYGLREIAAALHCSEKSVLRYVAQYGLPAGKIGGRWCADEARLREWQELVLMEHTPSTTLYKKMFSDIR